LKLELEKAQEECDAIAQRRSDGGVKGGNRGTTNNHVVLLAESNYDAAIKEGRDEITIAESELKLELEKAQEECDAIAQRRTAPWSSKAFRSKLQLDMVKEVGLCLSTRRWMFLSSNEEEYYRSILTCTSLLIVPDTG
jgi:hypothetical protein